MLPQNQQPARWRFFGQPCTFLFLAVFLNIARIVSARHDGVAFRWNHRGRGNSCKQGHCTSIKQCALAHLNYSREDASIFLCITLIHQVLRYGFRQNSLFAAHQVITTDTSNPLIRALKQKQPKPRGDLRASAGKDKDSLKRSATEQTNDSKVDDTEEASAKRLRPTNPAPAPIISLPSIPATGLDKLTKTQLEHILRAYNLPVNGSKVSAHSLSHQLTKETQGQLVARVTQLQHRLQFASVNK